MRLMLDSLTFIVLVFHFCPIYLKKKLKSVYNSRHLNQKGQKKKVRKGTDYRERARRKKRKKKKEEERRRRKKKKNKESRESSLVYDYGHMVVTDFYFYFFFFSYLFMPAEISIPAEIGQNDRNSSKWAEIFFEVE